MNSMPGSQSSLSSSDDGQVYRISRSYQDSANYYHSGRKSPQDHHHDNATPDGANCSDHQSTGGNLPGSEPVTLTNLAESCTIDDSASIPDSIIEEHAEAAIEHLVRQVDQLCTLLDTFRWQFRTKLHALKTTIKDLPANVGGAYNARQRAYLLHMYANQVGEAGESALQKLNYDLTRLIELGHDARLYTGNDSMSSLPSVSNPSPSSSMVLETPADVPADDETDWLGSFRRAMYAFSWNKPAPEVAVDGRGESSLNYGETQHPLAGTQDNEAKHRRECLVDFHEKNCPEDLDLLNCESCIIFTPELEAAS